MFPFNLNRQNYRISSKLHFAQTFSYLSLETCMIVCMRCCGGILHCHPSPSSMKLVVFGKSGYFCVFTKQLKHNSMRLANQLLLKNNTKNHQEN